MSQARLGSTFPATPRPADDVAHTPSLPTAPRASRAPARSDAEDRTRSKVLAAVLEHGPVSAAELGERLGFTPAAVRRHLDALSRKQLIEVKLVGNPSSGAGRPARRYVLSQRGQTELGTDYLSIAKAALAQLQEMAGPDAVEQFARTRFAEMETRYRPLVEAAGPDLEDRARALAGALTTDGFVGSTTVVGRNAPNTAMLAVQLCQGHCPVQELAAEFPSFCDQETEVFSRLLGVDVRRLSTLARGGHVCTTHIPVGRVTPAPAGADTSELEPTVSTHQQERP
ncbi:helix-turn-helix domain-containing protein [Arthrobacter sp. 260]|uniref:helix-turn-helix transcriptional regulator n=1 Tax=Arthrobacter sp. 260 TaxID=2735314 RepID=UPI0014923094|nr:helix-turn-helix domain-containing protein [Arthrobacter sp. 260]NOJ59534.1 MarR family transcriptional regulator [Arthrobacter sp. 260]